MSNQFTADAASLVGLLHGEALEFGKFAAVDFDGGKPDHVFLSVACFSQRDEPVSRQLDDFGLGAGQKQPLHDVGPHERVNRRRVIGTGLANRDSVGNFGRPGILCGLVQFGFAQFNCTGLVASLIVLRICSAGASCPVKSLNW